MSSTELKDISPSLDKYWGSEIEISLVRENLATIVMHFATTVDE